MGVRVEQDGRWNVGGLSVFPEAEFTRPADTTQYTANDVVAQSTTAASNKLLVFRNCVLVPGGTGILYSGLLFASTDAATNPNFSLALFNTEDITIAADNAASTVTDAQARNMVAAGTFDGTNGANVHTLGANLVITATSIGQTFKCAEGSRNLYGLVIDRGGYTPASAEIIAFKIFVLQD